MRILLLFILVLSLYAPTAHAFSKKRKVQQPLKNLMWVTRIELASENSMAGSWPSSISCSQFRGTHAGNEITFWVEGRGGDEEYRHVLQYHITKSYKLGERGEERRQETRKGNGKISITLPDLEDNVPFVQQTVFLITRDMSGHTVTTSMTFLVARPIIMMPSRRPEAKAKECFERYTAYESSVGVLSNATTNPSTISIKQGTQKIWGSSQGWQFGVFISPLAWLGIGNLISLNASYFTQISKQTVESTEIASGYTLSPGDFMQVYEQPTRYLTAYDATLVDPCGKTSRLAEPVLVQWWGVAYQIYPVDPNDKARTMVEAVGAPPINTCPKELSPLSEDEVGRNGNHMFVRTNQ